jgi:hypothetical protein
MQHYLIQIDEAGGDEPLVLNVTVASDARVLEVARDWLARSPRHVSARVWRAGEPVFNLTRDDA